MLGIYCRVAQGYLRVPGIINEKSTKVLGLKSKISGEPEISFAASMCRCHQWAARLMSLMCSASAATDLLILGIRSEINGYPVL